MLRSFVRISYVANSASVVSSSNIGGMFFLGGQCRSYSFKKWFGKNPPLPSIEPSHTKIDISPSDTGGLRITLDQMANEYIKSTKFFQMAEGAKLKTTEFLVNNIPDLVMEKIITHYPMAVLSASSSLLLYFLARTPFVTKYIPIQRERWQTMINAAVNNTAVYLNNPPHVLNLSVGDAKKNTICHHAIVNGNFDAARAIISRNPNFFEINDCGRTPLYEAASRGYVLLIDDMHVSTKAKKYVSGIRYHWAVLKRQKKHVHDLYKTTSIRINWVAINKTYNSFTIKNFSDYIISVTRDISGIVTIDNITRSLNFFFERNERCRNCVFVSPSKPS